MVTLTKYNRKTVAFKKLAPREICMHFYISLTSLYAQGIKNGRKVNEGKKINHLHSSKSWQHKP